MFVNFTQYLTELPLGWANRKSRVPCDQVRVSDLKGSDEQVTVVFDW